MRAREGEQVAERGGRNRRWRRGERSSASSWQRRRRPAAPLAWCVHRGPGGASGPAASLCAGATFRALSAGGAGRRWPMTTLDGALCAGPELVAPCLSVPMARLVVSADRDSPRLQEAWMSAALPTPRIRSFPMGTGIRPHGRRARGSSTCAHHGCGGSRSIPSLAPCTVGDFHPMRWTAGSIVPSAAAQLSGFALPLAVSSIPCLHLLWFPMYDGAGYGMSPADRPTCVTMPYVLHLWHPLISDSCVKRPISESIIVSN